MNKRSEIGDTYRNGTCPRLVDSHAHLDAPEFDADRADAVRRAFAAGVEAILCPADLTRAASFAAIAGLMAEFPTVLAAAGVHAHQAKDSHGGPSPRDPAAGRTRRSSGGRRDRPRLPL
ncbi:MAG: TatD family hydrolase [Candidatus Moduliflexus flocculans]|nr:TatD family hydrolase [Candidatus Moduliflexus flocculans]